jgi:hypothetical protein
MGEEAWGKAGSVIMSGYRWEGGNGREIIDDIRRGYNLYKRPRFQREGDVEVVTSNDEWSWRGSIPGAQRLGEHPTSPSRDVKSQMFGAPVSRPGARGGRFGTLSGTRRDRPRRLQPKLCPKALTGAG